MTPIRISILLAGLGLASACQAADRGLVSPHQPVVRGATASVPGCPNWGSRKLGEREGQDSNYGCATAMNLAAMIADPADLVRGQTGGAGNSAEIAARAIKSYRETPPSGKGGQVEKVSAKGGN